jgi:hypothetical protein
MYMFIHSFTSLWAFTVGERFDKRFNYIALGIIAVFVLVVALAVNLPCSFRDGTTPPQVTDLQIWRVACDILNRQWRTADKE